MSTTCFAVDLVKMLKRDEIEIILVSAWVVCSSGYSTHADGEGAPFIALANFVPAEPADSRE